MHRIWIAIALGVLLAMPAAASEKTDAMATVRQFVQAFNQGDTKTAAAVCAEETYIIDDFPPHEWHGAGACSQWMNDYDADARRNGIAGGKVTLAAPRHVEINGNRAYVVVPANYAYKQRGKLVRETGSLLTVVLQKGVAGWRIVAWTWSKH